MNVLCTIITAIKRYWKKWIKMVFLVWTTYLQSMSGVFNTGLIQPLDRKRVRSSGLNQVRELLEQNTAFLSLSMIFDVDHFCILSWKALTLSNCSKKSVTLVFKQNHTFPLNGAKQLFKKSCLHLYSHHRSMHKSEQLSKKESNSTVGHCKAPLERYML